MVKIRYKFVGIDEYFTCYLTLKQYNNFKELEVIDECETIENGSDTK